MPFDLQVREPRMEYVQHCIEFSKKTGDYASLSGIDIKVIALTYELEIEHVGSDHLRKEPLVSKIIASKNKPEEFQNKNLAGFYNPKNSKDDCEKEKDHQNENIKDKVIENEITEEELEKCLSKLNCDSEDNEEAREISISEHDSDFDEKDEEEYSDDSDDGWITPANIKAIKQEFEGTPHLNTVPLVACMSTDFAIQNVLKQINLNIAGLNGLIVKNFRTYILRCYTCFKTTSIITKIFCPNCGNKTLKRVAVSLDENGKQVVSYISITIIL